jgi:hypothetical protein
LDYDARSPKYFYRKEQKFANQNIYVIQHGLMLPSKKDRRLSSIKTGPADFCAGPV